MSKLGISTGLSPNDGNGDTLLQGALDINSNFDEIYGYFGNGTDLTSGVWSKTSVGINTLSKVGIGTTNPTSNLTVSGTATFTGIVTASSFKKSGGTSSQFLKADGSIDSNVYLTSYSEQDTLDLVTTRGNSTSNGISVGIITATSFKKSGGTSSQFLKADGSVDSNAYLTSASGLESRGTVSETTPSIGNNNYSDLTFSGGYKAYSLLKVAVSAACWVILYTDIPNRTSDAASESGGRDQYTDPTPGSGVIAEVLTASNGTVLMTPAVIGWNNDATPSTNIYARVVNLSGSAQAITVTLTILKLES